MNSGGTSADILVLFLYRRIVKRRAEEAQLRHFGRVRFRLDRYRSTNTYLNVYRSYSRAGLGPLLCPWCVEMASHRNNRLPVVLLVLYPLLLHPHRLFLATCTLSPSLVVRPLPPVALYHPRTFFRLQVVSSYASLLSQSQPFHSDPLQLFSIATNWPSNREFGPTFQRCNRSLIVTVRLLSDASLSSSPSNF